MLWEKSVWNNLFYAEFLAYYTLENKSNKNCSYVRMN